MRHSSETMADADVVALKSEHPFSLRDTLKSGQLFHWEPLSLHGCEGVAGCIGDGPPAWIAQPDADTVLTLSGGRDRVVRYFGLDQPMGEIHATFPAADPVLAEAIAYCPGIRVARQPVWECLATFLTSSLKQVAHIRAISLALRRRYGVRHELAGREFFAYPTPVALAAAGETALRECALGYRARSLALAAEAVASGELDLVALRDELDGEAARGELMRLHGVGEKIASCVGLFGCGHWGAFPIDVWMERVLRRSYRKRVRGAKLHAWAMGHFGPYAGYAQQYLFHFARKTF